jgi:Meiosis-specific coiled-coil domain-containing protein MEIOC
MHAVTKFCNCDLINLSFFEHSDVLALASALNSLTINTRGARTALWCALQLASSDLPPKCIYFAKQTTERRFCPNSSVTRSPVPWECQVGLSAVQQACWPQTLDRMNSVTNEYDDEVFTDTEEELDVAEKTLADD